jgi:membrane protein implicated in regulation of membrane protease activity
MLVLAHAGHWLVQLIYLLPLAVLAGVIVAAKLRERREARQQHGASDRDGRN